MHVMAYYTHKNLFDDFFKFQKILVDRPANRIVHYVDAKLAERFFLDSLSTDMCTHVKKYPLQFV